MLTCTHYIYLKYHGIILYSNNCSLKFYTVTFNIVLTQFLFHVANYAHGLTHISIPF